MIRLLMALILAVATGCAAQPGSRTVDLDQPGAFEALEKSNPQHFAKLKQLVDDTFRRDEAAVERVVRTAGGTEIHRGNLLRTSYPAKARLSFALDGTRYEMTVTVDGPPPRPK